MVRGITSLSRYLYLNIYAFLLVFLGIGIAFIPLYLWSGWLIVIQVVATVSCIYNGLKIFATWRDKKRKYEVLLQRNRTEFRPETFYEYMQAPCGRLLVRVVLSDLDCPCRYRELLSLREPLRKRITSTCRPARTVVYINPSVK